MSGKTFKCAQCGGVFDKGRSDEEANAEALDLWGVENATEADGMAVVCDDCFKAFMSAATAEEN